MCEREVSRSTFPVHVSGNFGGDVVRGYTSVQRGIVRFGVHACGRLAKALPCSYSPEMQGGLDHKEISRNLSELEDMGRGQTGGPKQGCQRPAPGLTGRRSGLTCQAGHLGLSGQTTPPPCTNTCIQYMTIPYVYTYKPSSLLVQNSTINSFAGNNAILCLSYMY